jgi:hypothetical protein
MLKRALTLQVQVGRDRQSRPTPSGAKFQFPTLLGSGTIGTEVNMYLIATGALVVNGA